MNQKLLKLTAFLLILIVALASSCQPEEPKEIEYTILPESLNFDATGGEDGFTVSVKSPAIVESVESLSEWCQVSTSGVAPVNVSVRIDPNTDGPRNTSVVVNMKLGENKTSVTVQISQDGAEIEYEISPASLNFDALGGEAGFTVSVKSPAMVESIESLSAWCQVSTSGIFPINVSVRIDPNTDGPRNTSVAIHMKLGEYRTSVTAQIYQEGIWVLINDVKWATCNVDMPGTFAAKPEDAGMFYQNNRRVGWSATDPMINSDGGTTWDNSYPGGDTWEKDNDPCPSGWRVPTQTELLSLQNANSQWVTRNDVSGRIFGSNNNSLFLPAAGCRAYDNGSCTHVGTHGYYWSSVVAGNSAYYLAFSSMGIVAKNHAPRTYGHSVRCVQE
ncbi:MAG: hypothetical protein FWD09_08660 [Lentimicrobiaceae bacterium]|nr:hypothetical protein [Lentimicrobiaceae bacterium]